MLDIHQWHPALVSCAVCDEPIDDFHEQWLYTDPQHLLRIHAQCVNNWHELAEEMSAAGEPFDAALAM
jgi:hypothetical protein